MKLIIRYLQKLGVLSFQKKDIIAFKKEGNIDFLILATKKANPSIKILAIRQFCKLGYIDSKVKKQLISLLYDTNLNVAEEAEKTLHSKVMSRELQNDEAYLAGIASVEQKKKERKTFFESISSKNKQGAAVKFDRKRLKRRNRTLPTSPYG